jgi:hypothetical protein
MLDKYLRLLVKVQSPSPFIRIALQVDDGAALLLPC